MTAPTLPPYTTSTVWGQAYSSLQWLSGQVAAPGASGQPASLASKAVLVLTGLQAGLSIMNIQDILLSSSWLLQGIQEAGALPISYPINQALAISDAITTLSLLPGVLAPLVPASFPAASGLLAAGQPPLYLTGGADLLSVLFNYQGVPAPSNYQGTWVDLQVEASGTARTWAGIVEAVSGFYGSAPQFPLDACIRAAQASSLQASIISGMPPVDAAASYLSPNVSWNQSYATPLIVIASRLVNPDVSLLPGQASMVTRSFLAAMSEQVSVFAIIMAGLAVQASGSSVTSQQGQGLMDIASQALGNFELWQSIRGNLPPPWGASEIPTGSQISLVSGAAQAPTQAAILGTDIELGPQGQAMPPWTGDFTLSQGIVNYSEALGRRLATTLGSLLYHPTYGCRIPPEIGQIMTTGANALIAAFGQSALAADPRTQKVISATAGSISGQPNAIGFQGVVQPIGPGLPAVSVNEVITAPAGVTQASQVIGVGG